MASYTLTSFDISDDDAMHDHLPPSLSDVLMVLGLSTVSAIIAIGRRVVSGHKSSCVWFVTEFLTAILCGYLMYTAYPFLVSFMPKWVTEPVAIALAAHSGGRIIQASEGAIVAYLERLFIKP